MICVGPGRTGETLSGRDVNKALSAEQERGHRMEEHTGQLLGPVSYLL